MIGKVIPLHDRRGATATKGRILDASEALFMEHGFEATQGAVGAPGSGSTSAWETR